MKTIDSLKIGTNTFNLNGRHYYANIDTFSSALAAVINSNSVNTIVRDGSSVGNYRIVELPTANGFTVWDDTFQSYIGLQLSELSRGDMIECEKVDTNTYTRWKLIFLGLNEDSTKYLFSLEPIAAPIVSRGGAACLYGSVSSDGVLTISTGALS